MNDTGASTILSAAPGRGSDRLARERAGGSPDDQASRLRTLVEGAAPRRETAEPVKAQRRCPVLALTSGKGGVGKTCTGVNLCIALSAMGLRVTLLDADLGLANADVLCGMTPTTRLDSVVGAMRAGQGRTLSQIAVQAPGGFRLVPGAVGLLTMADLNEAQRSMIVQGLADLETGSDLIVIDTGAGLHGGVMSFVTASDLALVIATPDPTSIADAYAMLKCASQLLPGEAAGRLALVVNQASGPEEATAVHTRVAAVSERFLRFKPRLMGVLRSDEALQGSVRARRPLLLDGGKSKFGKDIETLAESVADVLKLPARRNSAAGGGFLRRLLFGR